MNIVIMRGLPGCGKSTMAEQLKRYAQENGYSAIICSNDDYPGYYNAEGVYEWTPERAKSAKRWCQDKFMKAISDGVAFIVVDNTNLNEKSYGFYQKAGEDAGYQVAFNEVIPHEDQIPICAKRNKHNVTESMLRQMLKAWR